MATFRVTSGVLEGETVGGNGDHIWGPTDPRPTPPIVVYPPPPDKPDEPPLVIWGPNDPRPVPPIYLPPVSRPPNLGAHPEHPIVIVPPSKPDEPPLVIWGGPGSLPPFASPPIYLPPIEQPPEGTQPPDLPPLVGGWIWVECGEHGWCLKPPGDGGKPQPVPPPEGSTPPTDPSAPEVTPHGRRGS